MQIIKGLTEKEDGNMRIIAKLGADNRERYLSKINLKSEDLVIAGLTHGNKVAIVNRDNAGGVVEGCDALVTSIPHVILGVTAADCTPIYFYNKQKSAIGIAHAGWRGVKTKIAEEVVKIFIKEYSISPSDIIVEIGPHILDCHFEIQDDLVQAFSDYPESSRKEGERQYLSMQKVIEKQLLSCGLSSENITHAEECTHCESKYFSYRRDKPQEIEAMLAYIVLKE